MPNTQIEHADDTSFCFALQPVAEGEELTRSYKEYFEDMTARQRINLLKIGWQFTCDCAACEVSGNMRLASDMRRTLIGGLKYPLEGTITPDFSIFDNYDEAAKQRNGIFIHHKLPVPLSAVEATTRWLVYAKLREAEGLIDDFTASAYDCAVSVLWDRMVEGVINTRAVENSVQWSRHALATWRSCRPSEYRCTVAAERRLHMLETSLEYETVLRFVSEVCVAAFCRC